MSKNGCHLVQHIAKAAGAGLENMVLTTKNPLLPTATSPWLLSWPISPIMCEWDIKLTCQDKNVQTRIYAIGCLKAIQTSTTSGIDRKVSHVKICIGHSFVSTRTDPNRKSCHVGRF